MIHVAPNSTTGVAWLAFVLSIGLCAAEVHSQQIQPVGYTSSGYGSGGWDAGGWNSGWGTGSSWNGGATVVKQWRLGVTGSNTEVGVSINSVAPNSAAARVGLAPGDLVICVDGDQVGLVGAKVFDIGEELNSHADSAGRVSMIVQQRRSSQVRLLQVQLDDPQGGLTGNLVIRNGTLPPNSVVTVQLENVTRPYFVIRNGQQTFRPVSNAQGTIPYALNYDPSYISASDTYQLRAYITYNGSTIFETVKPELVLTQGNPSRVDLYLSPASFAFSGNPGTGTIPAGSTVAGYGSYDSISQQVTAAYQRYLGRPPTTTELAAWHQMPDINYRLTTLPMQFLGSQEYYDRAGNNNLVWLERVFTEMVGRPPSPTELDQWNRRFADVRYSRTEILNEFAQVSGR